MTIPFEVLRDEWLKDSEIKDEYDKLAPEFEALEEEIRARMCAGNSSTEGSESRSQGSHPHGARGVGH